jgi:ArsR family transcriptional regulator
MENLYERHADVCKTFSNAKRLEVINALRDAKERTAGDLLKAIEISKANLSQHMAVLVEKGVVESRREGVSVFYRLSDARITKACDLMREVLIAGLEKQSALLRQARRAGGKS